MKNAIVKLTYVSAFLFLLFGVFLLSAAPVSAATDVKYSPLFEASLANSLSEFAEKEQGAFGTPAEAALTEDETYEDAGATASAKPVAMYNTPTTSYSCGATCGSTCGSTCSATCGYSCGSTCGTTCGSTCNTTCNTTCTSTCTLTCNTTCQTTCNTTCLSTCGTTCQATCVGNSTCQGSYTCMSGATCQGSVTCSGFATCLSGYTCIAGTTCPPNTTVIPVTPSNPDPEPSDPGSSSDGGVSPSEPLPEQLAMDYDSIFSEEADMLYALGLFKGSDKGYQLANQATRAEAAVMLVRLLGKEAEAQSGAYSHPFGDVPNWANGYVGYLYQNGITNGISASKFGSSQYVNHLQYLTFLLKTLGYTDSDFSWKESDIFAARINLYTDEDADVVADMVTTFRRAHMVHFSCLTLLTELKGETDYVLMDKLIEEGAISEEALENFI